MIEAVGRKVVVLRRLRLGSLHLGTLGSGAFRELTDAEVEGLYAVAKRAEQDAGASPERAHDGS
jgi:16S rRNA U516 pseudouridylate synthase RsuA-like enzyme